MHALIQLQLSNYDSNGKWILQCDSGFQMMFGRMREMLKLDKTITFDVLGPRNDKLLTGPYRVAPDIFDSRRVQWIPIDIMSNALATRYDFNFEHVSRMLRLGDDKHKKYDFVYINDPMLLRHYKALFHVKAGYKPKFVVHSHFIDDPATPKFPVEASLWMGQVEAARKADLNFWQCESAMNVFFDAMSDEYLPHVVDAVKAKSSPWDDGYSSEEMNIEPVMSNIRFDTNAFKVLATNKIVIFVPNRVGGLGRSSDYTNCGHFLFNVVPELWKLRRDFIVLAGNPNQKFSNDEIKERCPGYMKLVPDAFNRDEYKWLAKHSHIAMGLYNDDAYGGTAARELLDAGCLPLWTYVHEYASMALEAKWPWVVKPDMSDIVSSLNEMIPWLLKSDIDSVQNIENWREIFRDIVRKRCSYEWTSPVAYDKILSLVSAPK